MLAQTIADGKRISFWWTMGVNQSHEATRTAQAIINLALITGNIGCIAQIGKGLADRGRTVPIVHTAELLDWAMQTVQLELGLSIRAAVRSAVAEAVNESLEKLRRDRDTSNTPL